MNLTSKQRAYLKSKAQTMDPVLQIGKSSVTTELVQSISEAIEKRELIKLHILQNCLDDPKEIANTIAERTQSTVVQIIGKKIVLFKQKKKDSAYTLPL
ncbi:MAG: ribosome assembly RNA-binding protein YhbY [Lachnospiraceae bacterium]|jgi:RNA-binding protein|nr:ribosome assembly RNA-binding protein YhbY [Lachnospiraceae bacterium]MBQ9342193.1 ribosome assembly RNA-binding protein YhbY [Lachnospiraceae bacterium]MBQ9580454.1 ribosome assembly RNA-binding protein YhbY [Lachnospiraceae bacterium]